MSRLRSAADIDASVDRGGGPLQAIPSSTSNSVLYRQFRRLLELVAVAREAGVDIGNHDLLDFARYDSLLKICALPQRLGELSGRLI